MIYVLWRDLRDLRALTCFDVLWCDQRVWRALMCFYMIHVLWRALTWFTCFDVLLHDLRALTCFDMIYVLRHTWVNCINLFQLPNFDGFLFHGTAWRDGLINFSYLSSHLVLFSGTINIFGLFWFFLLFFSIFGQICPVRNAVLVISQFLTPYLSLNSQMVRINCY